MPRVTEKKRIKINGDCFDNPIFLNWLGVSGGRNYWLFGKRQSFGKTTEVKDTFEPYQSNIETAQGYVFETGRNSRPQLTIGASVDIEDAEGIATVLDSPNVLMLMNPETWETESPIWQIVEPVAGSYKLWNTDQTRAEIEFTIRLTKINIQGT